MKATVNHKFSSRRPTVQFELHKHIHVYKQKQVFNKFSLRIKLNIHK